MSADDYAGVYSSSEDDYEHWSTARPRFLRALQDAAVIAGPKYFGHSDVASVRRTTDKWQLVPQIDEITRDRTRLTKNEFKFIAAVCSFNDAARGGRLLRKVGFNGFADLSGLDLDRIRILSRLIENYNGW